MFSIRPWARVLALPRRAPVFARFASSPAAPSIPSPPRPPQKHKKAKTKTKAAEAAASTTTILPPRIKPKDFSFINLLPLTSRHTTGRLGTIGLPLLPADGKAVAFTTAESYDLSNLLETLYHLQLLDGAVNLLGEALYLPRWSPSGRNELGGREGEVFVFESGTFVLWGLGAKEAETFLRTVVRGQVSSAEGRGPGWVEKGRYEEPEVEELDYRIEAGKTQMLGDVILLPSHPPSTLPATPNISKASNVQAPPSHELLARLAFSAAMARMTKLGVYEERMDEFSEGTAGIPALLEQGSQAPVKKNDIVMRMGKLHAIRQKINLEDENLLDEPEFLWEDARLHNLYSSLCKALEFDSRLETLNKRVDYAFQLQSSLMELLNTNTSHRLEWIIIVLILVEVVIVVVREGHAAIEWLNSDDSTETIPPTTKVSVV